MNDLLISACILSVASLAMMALASLLLIHFIALRSPPSTRAAWTTGISYLLAVTALIFGGIEGYELSSVLAAIPAAALLFWWLRGTFRAAWVEDPENTDAPLANDDWKVGLSRLAMLIMSALIATLVRQHLNGR